LPSKLTNRLFFYTSCFDLLCCMTVLPSPSSQFFPLPTEQRIACKGDLQEVTSFKGPKGLPFLWMVLPGRLTSFFFFAVPSISFTLSVRSGPYVFLSRRAFLTTFFPVLFSLCFTGGFQIFFSTPLGTTAFFPPTFLHLFSFRSLFFPPPG